MILGCRDELSGQRVCDEIAAETDNHDIHCRLLDLASLASVRRFADQFLRSKLPRHSTVLSVNVSYNRSLWQLASMSLWLSPPRII